MLQSHHLTYSENQVAGSDNDGSPMVMRPNNLTVNMKYEVYESGGQWRWRFRAANGKIIANSGEYYHNKADCLAATITSVKGSAYAPPVEVVNATGKRPSNSDLNAWLQKKCALFAFLTANGGSPPNNVY